MDAAWMTVKEASALLGYNPDYFRRTFCDPVAPLITVRPGRRGSRTLVLRYDIETLIDNQTRRPA